jgi:ABC-2 type transport system permease protein
LLVSGILLRYGLGAENLVWSLMFIIQPLGCVYYPVAALPSWLRLAIDSLLFVGAAFGFARLLASARRAGTLLQTGE